MGRATRQRAQAVLAETAPMLSIALLLAGLGYLAHHWVLVTAQYIRLVLP